MKHSLIILRIRASALPATALLVSCLHVSAQTRRPAPIPTPNSATTPAQQPANSNRGMLGAPQPNVMLGRPGLLGGDVEQMSPAQFRALTDTAMLRYRGQSLTKANFIQQRLKQFQIQARSDPPKAGQNFEMVKAQFEQKQAADLASRNARAQAVMDALKSKALRLESSASYSALSKEALDLQRRYSASSPAQQTQLKQRALEIHNQLLRLEQGIQ
jgi:hypothetical protein